MAEEAFANHPDNKKVGGSAFPFVSHGGIDAHQYCDPGMTLLDWFAGMALAGFNAHPSNPDKPHEVSKYCYQVARAMLAERGAQSE